MITNGNEIWVKRFGGNNPFGQNESGGAIVDKVNNYIYYSGRFYGTLIIDADTVTSTNLDPFWQNLIIMEYVSGLLRQQVLD